MPGWPGRSRHPRGRWRRKWPASGQLPGRDSNGGYARRRLGGSASDVGSTPTASTIFTRTRDSAPRIASLFFPNKVNLKKMIVHPNGKSTRNLQNVDFVMIA